MGEHRVGPQRDGAAVGLDRAKRLLIAQRGVAPGDERPVIALPRGLEVGHGPGHRDGGQNGHHNQGALHGSCGSGTGLW